jgi:hypothetical protein
MQRKLNPQLITGFFLGAISLFSVQAIATPAQDGPGLVTFVAGTPALAEEVNENFQFIEMATAANATEIGDQDMRLIDVEGIADSNAIAVGDLELLAIERDVWQASADNRINLAESNITINDGLIQGLVQSGGTRDSRIDNLDDVVSTMASDLSSVEIIADDLSLQQAANSEDFSNWKTYYHNFEPDGVVSETLYTHPAQAPHAVSIRALEASGLEGGLIEIHRSSGGVVSAQEDETLHQGDSVVVTGDMPGRLLLTLSPGPQNRLKIFLTGNPLQYTLPDGWCVGPPIYGDEFDYNWGMTWDADFSWSLASTGQAGNDFWAMPPGVSMEWNNIQEEQGGGPITGDVDFWFWITRVEE